MNLSPDGYFTIARIELEALLQFTISQDDGTTYDSRICFGVRQGSPFVVATDGHTLCKVSAVGMWGGDDAPLDFSFCLSTKDVKALIKRTPHPKDEIGLKLNDSQASVRVVGEDGSIKVDERSQPYPPWWEILGDDGQKSTVEGFALVVDYLARLKKVSKAAEVSFDKDGEVRGAKKVMLARFTVPASNLDAVNIKVGLWLVVIMPQRT